MADRGEQDGAGSYISRIGRISHNAVLYLIFVLLTTFHVGVYDVIFNLYILRLGFGEEFLGLLLSISSASIGLFSIPSGSVCDRLGQKRSLVISYAILSISLLLLYSSTSRETLAFASILRGAALSLSLVVGAAFLVENSTRYERVHLFSLYYAVHTLSMLSGNLIGGLMPGLLSDLLSLEQRGALAYRLALYASLAAVTVSLLPLSCIREAGCLGVRRSGSPSAFRSLAQERNARRMVLVYCLIGLGWGTSLPYFNVYFDTVLGAGTDQIGLIFSSSQLIMAAGYLMVPLLTARLGRIRMASSVQALSIPFLMVFVSASNIPVAALGYAMRYMLMNMANPVLNSFKLEIVSSGQRAAMNSMTWTACYTFVGIGTYAGGVMMAEGRSTMPFLITGGIYALTAVLYYIYFNGLEEGQRANKADRD